MSTFEEVLNQHFPYSPTQGQAGAFKLISGFIQNKEEDKATFLLRGYAGTGKTTLISALVKSLRYEKYKYQLLAPTGRAAKVMSSYAKRRAFTIHKIIFKPEEDKKTGYFRFVRQSNTHKNTVFIVDEASMVGHYDASGSRSLLAELISFVFEDSESGNKLVLVGDTAQLPPVHQSVSPALDVDTLSNFSLSISETELKEVVRQEKGSGILDNATQLRDQIRQDSFKLSIRTKGFKDIYRMNDQRLEDGLRYAYEKFGIENTCVVCRSNREATLFNKMIRSQIHMSETEIDAGDFLMIVKNNYHWLPPDSPAGFLANGEFVQIQRLNDIEEIHGFRFADLTLRLIDYPDHPTFSAKVHLSTLHSFKPSLTNEEQETLFANVVQSHVQQSGNENLKVNEIIQTDEYLNALQIKFAYALTCHKSQGGQWDAVFVNMGFVKKDLYNIEWLRWLYTAFTRATTELYLVNFLPQFFR